MIKKILPSIFKVSLLSILLVGFNKTVNAQYAATPYGGYSGNIIIGQSTYHASESIYLNAELGSTSFTTATTAINHVDYGLNSLTAAALPVAVPQFKIYMKNVAAGTTTFTSGNYSLTGYTLVYDGINDYNISSVGWNGVNLTTPFQRTANSNLQVLILRDNGAAIPGYVFDAAPGNSSSSANNSSRRYNGTTASIALVATSFRPSIRLIHITDSDVTADDITTPVSSCYTANQSLRVTIKNTGLANAIGAGAVSVKLNVTGANTYTVTKNSLGAMALGDTQSIMFDNIPLPNVGFNTLQAIATLAGDGTNFNDTIATGTTHTTTKTTFPISEDAESPLKAFKYTAGLNDPSGYWGRPTRKYANGGMSDSITPHGGTGYYLYYSYDAPPGHIGALYSDCIDLPAGSTASVSFYMTHDTSFSTRHDSIFVGVSTDKGATWNFLDGFDRYDATYTTLDYGMHTANISAFAGQTIQVGILGQSAYGSSVAVDDIAIEVLLPIKLTSFTGVREGVKNVLKWSTANEANNKGFELQRSIDGKTFTTITFVNSKAINGSSSSVIDYAYTDEKPLAGTNYYRLRQLDNDGKASLSSIVAIKSAQTTKVEISRVYPNPVQDKLNVVVTTPASEKVTINITDLIGKTIATKTIETVSGDNNIQFNTTQLAKGTYLIKVNSSSNIELATQKFVK